MRQPPRLNAEFGRAVSEFLKFRRPSHRQAQNRTGINRQEISDRRVGRLPQFRTVVAFAEGFGEPVSKWLRLAGYAPLAEEYSPEKALMEGLTRICEERGSYPLEINREVLHDSTPEQVDAALRRIREALEEPEAA